MSLCGGPAVSRLVVPVWRLLGSCRECCPQSPTEQVTDIYMFLAVKCVPLRLPRIHDSVSVLGPRLHREPRWTDARSSSSLTSRPRRPHISYSLCLASYSCTGSAHAGQCWSHWRAWISTWIGGRSSSRPSTRGTTRIRPRYRIHIICFYRVTFPRARTGFADSYSNPHALSRCKTR